MTDSSKTRRGLYRASVALLLCTFWLILWGAYTNSLRAGMAFPDWPTSDGSILYFLPVSEWSDWTGEKFWEHSHRLIAGGLVGPLAVLIFIWSICRLPRGILRKLAALTLILVIVQGLFGAQTVREHLAQKSLSIIHGGLAQVCIAVMTALCVCLNPKSDSASPLASRVFALFPVAVLVQTLLGAVYRHTDSSTWLGLHFFGALVFSVIAAWVTMALLSLDDVSSHLKKLGIWLLVLLVLQLGLGTAAWLQRVSTEGVEVVPWTRAHIASVHVLMGSVFMWLSVAIYLRAKRPGWMSQ